MNLRSISSSTPTPPEAKNDIIMFTRGIPPAEAFSIAQLSACFDTALLQDPYTSLQYGQRFGYPPLRKLLASEYQVTEEEVLITNGSLQLLNMLATLVVSPGTTVITEQPSYDRAIAIFRQHRAQVTGIPLEADGLNLDLLEATVERQTPTLLYLVPDFQNPAGIVTSLKKRQAIAEMANRYGFWIVEDIPYRQLRYRGVDVPMLRMLNPQQVITISSFSKLLSPGLRVGYMVAPQSLVANMGNLAENTYLTPVLPTQALVATYLQQDRLRANVERLKQLYRPRWHAMIEAVKTYLSGSEMVEPDGGFFVGVTLPNDANTTDLVARAKFVDLHLTPGAPFFVHPQFAPQCLGERFIRLPFCAVTPLQIEEGVRRLASLL